MGIRVDRAPAVGVELGGASLTSNPAAATSTSFVAVSGWTTTVTTGARPVMIRVHAGQVINNNNTLTNVSFGLFRDGTEIAEATILLPGSLQFGGWPVSLMARDAPAAGTHTYEIRQKVGATGQSGNLLASATNPARIEVIEI